MAILLIIHINTKPTEFIRSIQLSQDVILDQSHDIDAWVCSTEPPIRVCVWRLFASANGSYPWLFCWKVCCLIRVRCSMSRSSPSSGVRPSSLPSQSWTCIWISCSRRMRNFSSRTFLQYTASRKLRLIATAIWARSQGLSPCCSGSSFLPCLIYCSILYI